MLYFLFLIFFFKKVSTAPFNLIEGLPWESFEISIERTGVFPNEIYPKVYWLGVEKGKHYLEGLHNSLNKILDSYIHFKDINMFVPHITIGRSTSILNYKNLNIQNYLNTLYSPISLNVNSIGLYESKLCSEGPSYTLLEKFIL